MTAPANPTHPQPNRTLIAPMWHTIGLIAIFVALSIAGGFFQASVRRPAKENPQAARSTSAVPGYISLIISEWLLVLYVHAGVKKRGVRLRDLVGGRWATPADVLKDIAFATGLWAAWIGLQNSHVLGSGENTALGLLPHGVFESLVWIPVALSAGFCEEIVFRGYLQKQFLAITGNALWAVLFQAIIFGIGHLYEGIGPVGRIMLFGILYGLVAVWRKSLRACMLAHAWSDIFGVIIFRGM
jgi:membrane protease YdiL (CAAX protease family)